MGAEVGTEDGYDKLVRLLDEALQDKEVAVLVNNVAEFQSQTLRGIVELYTPGFKRQWTFIRGNVEILCTQNAESSRELWKKISNHEYWNLCSRAAEPSISIQHIWCFQSLRPYHELQHVRNVW